MYSKYPDPKYMMHKLLKLQKSIKEEEIDNFAFIITLGSIPSI